MTREVVLTIGARLRWIDERLGVLDLSFGSLIEKRLDFTAMACKTYDRWQGTSYSMEYRDGHLWYGERDEEPMNWRPVLGNVDDSETLNQYYQKWLARTMLADDPGGPDGRKGRGKADPNAVRDEGSGAAKVHGPDAGDIGRVPLRQNGGNFPVVSREGSWRIRRP